MELLKLDDRPAEYTWDQVTFFFRTKVTVGDKYAVDSAGVVTTGDKITFTSTEFYKAMIRVFVTGWKGVTENGKDAPYSYDTFMNRLPASMADDLVMKLGYEIAKTNGFLKDDKEKVDEQKNV